jgi:hypothetical protein
LPSGQRTVVAADHSAASSRASIDTDEAIRGTTIVGGAAVVRAAERMLSNMEAIHVK